jgi:hypothetical protein
MAAATSQRAAVSRGKADKKLCLVSADFSPLLNVPRFIGSVPPNLRKGSVERLREQARMALKDLAEGRLRVACEIAGDTFEGSHGVVRRAG